MNRIFIVMDYVEHDLKGLMTHTMKKPFSIGEVKTLMYQLLAGVNHLHDNWIIHRDLKTSNLLLSNKGILKVSHSHLLSVSASLLFVLDWRFRSGPRIRFAFETLHAGGRDTLVSSA
jgi:serine/threonine protein kinase